MLPQFASNLHQNCSTLREIISFETKKQSVASLLMDIAKDHEGLYEELCSIQGREKEHKK